MGDSLSAEYGIARNRGWPALLTERLAERKFKWRVVNASVSGETTSGGLSRLPALLDQHRPALVVLELGANDGLRGLPVVAMKRNLQQMIALAHAKSARVLLVGMRIPPNYGRPYAESFQGVYRALANETRTPLVPFLFEGFADKMELFQTDHLHPTEAAQPLILDNLWPSLEPMLKARR